MPNALPIILGALLAPAALATLPPIDPVHKFSWSENCGHMNWRGNAAEGKFVAVYPTHLEGWIWCENIGWIRVGVAGGPPAVPPADGTHYPNTSDLDFGVNIDPVTGELSGFGWSENTDWINFGGGAMATPPNPARLDLSATPESPHGRFRGYAWGSNIGWINLDDAGTFVALGCLCAADINCSGTVSVQDIYDFLMFYFARDPRGDFNHTGTNSVQDIFDFLAAYFTPCE